MLPVGKPRGLSARIVALLACCAKSPQLATSSTPVESPLLLAEAQPAAIFEPGAALEKLDHEASSRSSVSPPTDLRMRGAKVSAMTDRAAL